MTPWPKPWTGGNPIAAWMNRLLNRCQQEVLLESKDFRRVQTSDGYFLEAKVQPGASKSPPSSSASAFVITSINQSDIVVAQKLTTYYNIPGKGVFADFDNAPIFISKPPVARRSIVTEVIDGVTITYRNNNNPPENPPNGYSDNNRIANDGTSDEIQVLYPRYVAYGDPGGGKTSRDSLGDTGGVVLKFPFVVNILAQSIIYAVPVSNNYGADWVEVGPARVWAKRFAL